MITTIKLDGSIPALQPCRKCGSINGAVHEPKPPHGNLLRCADCNQFHGWLSKHHPKSTVSDDQNDAFDVVDYEDDLMTSSPSSPVVRESEKGE